MLIKIKEIDINYEVEGNGKDLVLLHGWDSNLNIFDNLTNELVNEYKIWRIDLPGFGKSIINKPLTVLEVSDIVNEFIIKMNIFNPIILGHSYGGRIGIVYASKYDIDKLVLVSTPGFVSKPKLKKRIKMITFKTLKKMGIRLNMGSQDYRNSNDINKLMLVKTINQDLTKYMNKINCTTLLLYGKIDKVTSVSLGKAINKQINSSTLITLDECGHFPFIDRLNYFTLVLRSFLGDEYDN